MKSLQVAHRLEGSEVLLIGAGDVAMTRIPKLLPTGCKLTIIAPVIHDLLQEKYFNTPSTVSVTETTRVNDKWIPQDEKVYRIINENFNEVEHLPLAKTWSLILLCIPDVKESERIYHLCKEKYGNQQMINVADIPKLCDFYFGANVSLTKDGNLQILISSNGLSPRFTALIKNEISGRFNEWELDGALEKLGILRSTIRSSSDTNGDNDIKYRMQWIKKCTDLFGLEHCHRIDVAKLTVLFKEMAAGGKSLTFPSQSTMLNDYSE